MGQFKRESKPFVTRLVAMHFTHLTENYWCMFYRGKHCKANMVLHLVLFLVKMS